MVKLVNLCKDSRRTLLSKKNPTNIEISVSLLSSSNCVCKTLNTASTNRPRTILSSSRKNLASPRAMHYRLSYMFGGHRTCSVAYRICFSVYCSCWDMYTWHDSETMSSWRFADQPHICLGISKYVLWARIDLLDDLVTC